MNLKIKAFSAAVALLGSVALCGNLRSEVQSQSSTGGKVAAAARPKIERKLYAHYMGCWPAACGALPQQQKNEAKILAEQKQCWATCGGEFVNWPLVPQGWTTNEDAVAELEIRRAIRAGFDGFAVDAWSGSEGAKYRFEKLIAAAERMKVDFGVTICLDPSCHSLSDGKPMLDKFVASAKLVLRHRDSPNFARYDGKPLIFGYYSRGIIGWPFKWPSANDRAVFERDTKAIADAWARFRKELGFPIFLHGDIAGIVGFVPDSGRPMAHELGRWAATVFDAVGSFVGTEHGREWALYPELAAAVKAGGAVWSQPLTVQYQNKFGGIMSEKGLDLLRRRWERAIADDSPLMQFVTWNDYGEETVIAPAYGSNYTITRVNRYYRDWWKEGAPPEVTEDEIHVVFKRNLGEARIFPFYGRNLKTPGCTEVITFLTKPGRITVKGYGQYDAPAGMHYRQFPMREGAVEVLLSREESGKVLSFVTPEKISTVRWREDETMYAIGTNFESEWKRDFPWAEPFWYSENGDMDGDGLPNWFEMVYFGRMPFFETAAGADAGADPDCDGYSNLEEFRRQSDPRFADTPYAPGFIWSVSNDCCATVCTYNPHRDQKRNDVWSARYQVNGESEWRLCLAKEHAPQWRKFNAPHELHAPTVAFQPDGSVKLGKSPKCRVALVWSSPVTGEVLVNGKQVRVTKGRSIYFTEEKELEHLEIVLKSVD